MNNTYNEIIAHIKLFSEEHLDVFRFATDSEDQMSEITSKGEKFPMLFVTPISNGFNYIMNGYSLRVYCYDRNMKDRSNVSNIRSKTNQILTDLDTWLRKEVDMPFDLEEASTAYPFSDELMTDVTGWYIDFVFDSPASSICDIPFRNKPALPIGVCNGPTQYPEPQGCGYQLIYVQYLADTTTSTVPTDANIEGTVYGMDSGDLTNVLVFVNGLQVSFPFVVALGDEISFEYDEIDHQGVIILDFKGTFVNPCQTYTITVDSVGGSTSLEVFSNSTLNLNLPQLSQVYNMVSGDIEGNFQTGVGFTYDLVIDTDSAGTYNTIFNGGGLGILRLLKNSVRIESTPIVLAPGDVLSAARSNTGSPGFFKLVK